MDMLNQKQKIIAILVIVIVIIVIAYYYINSTKDVYTNSISENIVEETDESTNEIGKKQTIKIHITGAVKTNGVVEIEKDGRINDAIEAAGGITEDADLSDINLAYKIEDGQKIKIPSIDDKEEEKTQEQIQNQDQGFATQKQETSFIVPNSNNNNVAGEKSENSSKININKATFTELITLPGIGEATAIKILEYRKTNGNFQNIEQIKNVSGIGDAKFNVIKEYITV